MEITKNQLRQLIMEVLHDEEEFEQYNAPAYRLNDILVTALQRTLFEQFLEAGLVGEGPGQLTKNDIALEFEEPLMDALLPVAELANSMLGNHAEAYGYDDDEEYTMLPTPKEDPMGRGADTSALRRKVMGPVETLEEG